MWRMLWNTAGAAIALASVTLCGQMVYAQPAIKSPPKQETPGHRDEGPLGPGAFQLSDEQKRGIAESVDLAPWLIGIGAALLAGIVIAAILMRPEVLWWKKEEKLPSQLKKERREPGTNRYSLDLGDLDGD